MHRLRKRALVALGLCLTFFAGNMPEAKADYDSERERPGVASWLGAIRHNQYVSINLDTDLPDRRIYKVTWTVVLDCNFLGSFAMSGNNQGPHQGLEWDAAFPSGTVDGYYTKNNDGVTYYELISGFSGDEGFYRDTAFEDGSTKRLGWGVTNPNNLDRCDTSYNPPADNVVKVAVYVVGPKTPTAGKTIVWKINAMTQDPDVPCFPTDAWCFFPDYQHTLAKTGFKTSGNDGQGRTPTTPGYDVAFTLVHVNKIMFGEQDIADFGWAYHIPNNGYDCQGNYGVSPSWYTWCYDSGYQTGGDFAWGDGPPGDQSDESPRFGDIEGNNLVAFTADIQHPTQQWTEDQNKKAYATAEGTFKCVTPKVGRSGCLITFGYEGVADGDPSELRMANITIPADGNWRHCRVDLNHNATTQFTWGHDKYRWKVITDDRWLAFDNAFLGSKTELADNGYPANDMWVGPQCTNLGA